MSYFQYLKIFHYQTVMPFSDTVLLAALCSVLLALLTACHKAASLFSGITSTEYGNNGHSSDSILKAP
jgi:hypothetical protein